MVGYRQTFPVGDGFYDDSVHVAEEFTFKETPGKRATDNREEAGAG
jgi:hypothetical protein